jgi:hypothetical protein
MAQQYQAQQQSMSEQQQQPMQSNVIQTQPAPQISAPAPRAKKTLAIKDPNTLEAINAMDITQPRQKSTTNTGILMYT